MRRRVLAIVFAALPACATAAAAQELLPAAASWGNAADVDTLRRRITESAAAFNRGDPAAIMAPYARDIVLSYPGIPDLGYDSLVAGYARMTAPQPGVSTRTVPTIDEILVSGDLGIIRLRWRTTTTWTDPARTATREMKDLQVWRREPNGRWMFARGMHYRDSPPPPAPAAPADPAKRSGA